VVEYTYTYVQRLELESYSYEKLQKKPTLTLIWSASTKHLQTVTQAVTLFTPVVCRLVATSERVNWIVRTVTDWFICHMLTLHSVYICHKAWVQHSLLHYLIPFGRVLCQSSSVTVYNVVSTLSTSPAHCVTCNFKHQRFDLTSAVCFVNKPKKVYSILSCLHVLMTEAK